MTKAMLSALALLIATAAHADPVPDRLPDSASAPNQTASLAPMQQQQLRREQDAQQQRDWLESVAGNSLIGVDGSTLSFEPSENGLTRRMITSDGAEHDTSFVFINDKLGTVTDGSASSDVIGFFRKLDTGLELTYSDGRTETIAPATDGGVAMTLHTLEGTAFCMGWYPKGHVFAESERRAALALYAKRLGLAAPGGDAVASSASCKTAPGSRVADQAAPAKPVALPAPQRSPKHSKKHTAMLTPATPGETLAPVFTPVAVRDSMVHTIDAEADINADIDPQPDADPKNGASACLSVDSDGGHWGFRNRCGFDVAFSYCLRNAPAGSASCQSGAQSGIVIAKSFTPLMTEAALADKDAEHDFRWIACGQAAGAVEAHLDQTSPPQGRCIHSS